MAENEVNEPIIYNDTVQSDLSGTETSDETVKHYTYGDIGRVENGPLDQEGAKGYDVTYNSDTTGTRIETGSTRTVEHTSPSGEVWTDTTELNSLGEPVQRIVEYKNQGRTETYTYENGQPSQLTRVESNGNNEITSTYNYDNGRQVLTGRTVVEDKGGGDSVTRTYNGAGQLTGSTEVDYTDRGQREEVTTTVKDGDGNIISTSTTTNSSGHGDSTSTTVTTEYSDGQATTTKTVNDQLVETTTGTMNEDGSTTITSKTTIEYQTNGNPASRSTIEYGQDAESNEQTTTTTVNYNEQGLYNGTTRTIVGKDNTEVKTELDKTGQNYTITNTDSSGNVTTSTSTSNNVVFSKTTNTEDGSTTVTDLAGNELYTTDANGNIVSKNDEAMQEYMEAGLTGEDGQFDIDKFDLNEDQLMTAIKDLDGFMSYCNESASALGAVSIEGYSATTTTSHQSGSPHTEGFNDKAANLATASACLSGVCGTGGAQSGFSPLLGRLCNTVSLIRGSNQSVSDILNEAKNLSSKAGTESGDPNNFAQDLNEKVGNKLEEKGPGGTGPGGTNFDPSAGSGGDVTPEEEDIAKEEDTTLEQTEVAPQEQKPTTSSDGHDNSDAQKAYKSGGGHGGGGGSTKDSTAATNEDASTAINDMLSSNVPTVEIVETGNQVHDIGELSSLGADIGSINIETMTNHISAKNIGAAVGVGLAAAGAAAAIESYKDKKDEEEGEAMDDEYSSTDYQIDPTLNYDDLMI